MGDHLRIERLHCLVAVLALGRPIDPAVVPLGHVAVVLKYIEHARHLRRIKRRGAEQFQYLGFEALIGVRYAKAGKLTSEGSTRC